MRDNKGVIWGIESGKWEYMCVLLIILTNKINFLNILSLKQFEAFYTNLVAKIQDLKHKF